MSVDKLNEEKMKMRVHPGRRQTKTRLLQYSLLNVKKSELRTAILQELRQELSRQTKAATMAHEEAISEESQPENKWDTHSQEAAYLAEGQSRLVQEIGESIALYETLRLPDATENSLIAMGTVVGLQGARGVTWYFLGPRAGGLLVCVEDREILVVTPQSPLGRQLLGKQIGDTVTLPGTTKPLAQRITAIE